MSNFIDYEYADLLEQIINEGHDDDCRTGMETRSIFGTRMEMDISDGKVPLLSGSRRPFKAIMHELIWMLSGDTNIRYLKDYNVSIWDQWIDPTTAEYDEQGQLVAGDLPNIYQKQWRKWRHVDQHNGEVRYIDQIENVLNTLRTNPTCRRMLISAWNVGEINSMALPPCHLLVQFKSRKLTNEETVKRYGLSYEQAKEQGLAVRALSSQLYMRSSDVAIGLPFNIVFYSVMTQIFANETNHIPEKFIYVGGDTHIYHDQFDGVEQYIKQVEEEMDILSLPVVTITPNVAWNELTISDFVLSGYLPQPAIKFPKASA